MRGTLGKHALRAIALLAIALVVATSADARRLLRRHAPRKTEHVPPPVSVDSRDSIVATPGPYIGRPYWLSLAQCGGIYFKLNVLYTDAAVYARVVMPNVSSDSKDTKKLNEAINIATVYFDAAENFLRTDRQLGRDDAILIYDPQSEEAGDQIKSIDAGLAAVRDCPALYQDCESAYAKICSQKLEPLS
jgi:hypothetical protein